MEQERRHFAPVVIRSRIVLEIASELIEMRGWPYRQVRLSMREQGDNDWKLCLFGSDAPDVINELVKGDCQIAIINPAAPLTLAFRGTGPFSEPVPVRALAVIPSLDQFGFAVSERTGLTSLWDIRARRFPLKVSLRGQRNHSAHLLVEQVLSQVGCSLEDIVTWGGEVRYDSGLPSLRHIPDDHTRIGAVRRGEVNAIFDEAVRSWGDKALDSGMRFLPLEEPLLQRLEAIGFRRAVIPKSRHPKLPADVPTLDFSGWPIFTHASVPDEVVTHVCGALNERRGQIPWDGEGPLPLETMCRDTPEGPLDIPLHPAAERFWRDRGYLD